MKLFDFIKLSHTYLCWVSIDYAITSQNGLCNNRGIICLNKHRQICNTTRFY